MRTVKVTYDFPLDQGVAGTRLHVTTEVIIDDDADARQAGMEAQLFVTEFLHGVEEAAEQP